MPAPVYVCVWYDTEDYVCPASDDAALFLADMHTKLSLPATFKLVGQKARTLQERGRTDVLNALRRHDIGYHTDLHSVHPVVTEYCEQLPWDEGVACFRHLEAGGLADVQRLLSTAVGEGFEPKPISTFGQAGRAWAPQILPVLREWGIPTYVDEGPWLGLNGQPFWFMSVLHVTRMEQNLTRFNLRQPDDELDGAVRFDAVVKRLQEEGGGLVSVYFHPCEWSTDQFWDGANFARGANPPLDRLAMPQMPSPEESMRRCEAAETYLSHLARSEATGITASALPRLYPDHARSRYLDRQAVVDFTGDWEEHVDYVETEHGWLSAAELLTVVAELLRPDDATAPASAHRLARARRADGPRRDVPPLTEPLTVPFSALVSAAGFVNSFLRECGGRKPAETLAKAAAAEEAIGPGPDEGSPCIRPIPSGIPIGTRVVRPEEFLMGGLRALRTAVSSGQAPDEIELNPVHVRPTEQVHSEAGMFAQWPIFTEDFEAPRVMAHARRQCWTLKPAILNPEAGL